MLIQSIFHVLLAFLKDNINYQKTEIASDGV